MRPIENILIKSYPYGILMTFLTKSRLKIGYECPTKLCYLDNKEFGNNKIGNSFLEALAEGGFQVGELAKIYHSGGIEITDQDKNISSEKTTELLKNENIIIYEAAIKYQNLFIKSDIIIKTGNKIELIEVKAKSYDSHEDNIFYNKKTLKNKEPKLNSEWEPYLVDIAFQKYVLQKAFPQFEVKSYLMLADKNAVATVEGINQNFFIDEDLNKKVKVRVTPGTTKESLGKNLLIQVQVDNEINLIWNMRFDENRSFEEMVHYLSKICEINEFIIPDVGKKCKSCEFRIDEKLKNQGLKSGFENCWKIAQKLEQKNFERPFVFDIWNFKKSDDFILEKKIFIDQIDKDDIDPKFETDGLSLADRQWLQIEKIKTFDKNPYLDFHALQNEMNKWKFPLHFIDFETTMVAIPFHKGQRPYEQIAFQFSHHTVDSGGKILHANEYINRNRGQFPNFDFVRELRASLNNDDGTIFRYAAHENTVLSQIREQILISKEDLKNKQELLLFIESITKSSNKNEEQWEGSRNMVDMCELIKKYYYHPLTNGSNSIKKVLPAILNDSKYLQDRYSQPIYGNEEIYSHNYKNWSWIEKIDGVITDPYKRLPPIFNDIDLETMDSLLTEGSTADGGAAMTSYARMQFSEMSKEECDKVTQALLKYCELDTFAMVMIYEYWKHEVENSSKA